MKLREGLALTRTERFKDSVLDLDPRTREKLLEEILEAKKDILKGRFATYEDFFGKKLPEKR